MGDSDEDIAPETKAEPLLPTLSNAEKQELWVKKCGQDSSLTISLFPYPLTGRAELHITGGDRYRVKSGDFLNDTLLEFGLRYVKTQRLSNATDLLGIVSRGYQMLRKRRSISSTHSSTTNCRLERECDMHLWAVRRFLSSFVRGRYDQATQNWPAYNSVRKWTKGKSIFDMDYIVVPINEA